MIRKTCSFFLKLDSNDERHRRYRIDARTLSNVRENLNGWSFFSGTLRYIADKTQIATPLECDLQFFRRSAFTETIWCPQCHSLGNTFFSRFAQNLTGLSMKSVLESFSTPSKARYSRILLAKTARFAPYKVMPLA